MHWGRMLDVEWESYDCGNCKHRTEANKIDLNKFWNAFTNGVTKNGYPPPILDGLSTNND